MTSSRPSLSVSPTADRSLIDTLAAAVAKYGREWCGDRRRCEAMLKDLLPSQPRDVTILVTAVEAGAVRDLTASQSTLPLAVRIERLVTRLHDEQGLREDVARRAVGIWAVVLGAGPVPPVHKTEPSSPLLARACVIGVAALAVTAVVWLVALRPWPREDRPVRPVTESARAALERTGAAMPLDSQAGRVVKNLVGMEPAREAARRSAASNNLKLIVLAMLNEEAVRRSLRFPAPAICDKEGKPLLSWRVAILPFIDEQQLYERFRLDEPWDSDHNKKLIPLMPAPYQDPSATPEEIAGGLTAYLLLRGKQTAFPLDAEGPKLTSITDGTSRTLAVVEVSRRKAVPWTKPEDLSFDPDKPFDGLGIDRRPGGLFLGAFFDGHVDTFSPEVPPEVVRALVSPAAGDAVPR